MADGRGVFQVCCHTRADNSAVLLLLVLSGIGISRVLNMVARPYVAAGQLVSVLIAELYQGPFPIYAVMLQEQTRLPKIKACVNY